VSVNDPDWNGNEVVYFTAEDPSGASDRDPARFTVTAVNDAPAQSQLLTPAHNIFIEYSDSIRFEWSSAEDADDEPVMYDFTLRERDNQVEINYNQLKSTALIIQTQELLKPGTFYSWNVTTTDGHMEVESDTSVFYFTNPPGPSIESSGQFKNLTLIDTTIVLTEDTPALCPD